MGKTQPSLRRAESSLYCASPSEPHRLRQPCRSLGCCLSRPIAMFQELSPQLALWLSALLFTLSTDTAVIGPKENPRILRWVWPLAWAVEEQ